jgi:alkanesulfonate monooxygenase SsuD/methylene tetrahydromethanopterin reductase-like flavin-dependent oxidoreductase (luciferase family)
MDGFDVVAAVPSAVTDDREAAYETMRADLVTYWSLPFYRAMIERSGFGSDIAAFDAGIQAGDVEAAKRGISDGFLDSLTAIGTAEEVQAGLSRYRDAGATSPCVGPVPRTDFEATLEAALEAARG